MGVVGLVISDDALRAPHGLAQGLLRPGRFDRQITDDRPDRMGRGKIHDVHTRG